MSEMKGVPLPTFSSIGVTGKSDGKVVIFRLNISPEEWDKQTPEVKKILYITDSEKEEVQRYLNLDETTKRMIKAFVIANNALYFNDKSDYQSALWEICETLNPLAFESDEDEFVLKYVDLD